MKKLIATLCAVMCIFMSGMALSAEENENILFEKQEGNIRYTVYEDGPVLFAPADAAYRWCSIPDMVMYLEGGEDEEYSKTEYILYQEWNSAKTIIVEDGITEIGDFAFHHMHVERAEFSDDVTAIGTGAFMQGYMPFLDETVYPQNVG